MMVRRRIVGVESNGLEKLAHRIFEPTLRRVGRAELVVRPRLPGALRDDVAPERRLVLPHGVARVGGRAQRSGGHEQCCGAPSADRASRVKPLDGPQEGRAQGHGRAGAREVHPVLEDYVADRNDRRLDGQGEEEPRDSEEDEDPRGAVPRASTNEEERRASRDREEDRKRNEDVGIGQRIRQAEVVVEVLPDGHEEQPQVRDDHPRLGQQIHRPRDRIRLGGGAARVGKHLEEIPSMRGKGEGNEQRGCCQRRQQEEPPLPGTEEQKLVSRRHEGQRGADLLGLHGRDRAQDREAVEGGGARLRARLHLEGDPRLRVERQREKEEERCERREPLDDVRDRLGGHGMDHEQNPGGQRQISAHQRARVCPPQRRGSKRERREPEDEHAVACVNEDVHSVVAEHLQSAEPIVERKRKVSEPAAPRWWPLEAQVPQAVVLDDVRDVVEVE